jgi:hypothetical protein
MRAIALKIIFLLASANFCHSSNAEGISLNQNPNKERSPLQYQIEAEEHRQRIVEYAYKLYPLLPKFQNYWIYLIEYLELHDLPKVMSLDQIKKTYPNYEHSVPIYYRLAKFFGRDKKDLNSLELEELEEAIRDLNHIEKIIKANFKSNLPQGIPDFEDIEIVLDFIDTTLFRRLELNISNQDFDYFLAEKRFYQYDKPHLGELARKALIYLEDFLMFKLGMRSELEYRRFQQRAFNLNIDCEAALVF